MSVKVDESGHRSVAVEVEVPGTPEEVWQAIASGPGVSSWFIPTTSDERVGGTVGMDFGMGMNTTAEITEWNPPHTMAAMGQPQAPGAPPFATAWYVEAKSGGVCVVRVVHSLFADTDEWDNQLTGTETGWPSFFRVLKLYLTHFTGQPSASLLPMSFTGMSASEAWSVLTESLGLGDVQIGDSCATADGAPQLAGTVEFAINGDKHEMVIRTDAPGPGVAQLITMKMGPMTGILVRYFAYGDRAAETVAAEESKWTSWLAERFPAPEMPSEPISCS